MNVRLCLPIAYFKVHFHVQRAMSHERSAPSVKAAAAKAEMMSAANTTASLNFIS